MTQGQVQPELDLNSFFELIGVILEESPSNDMHAILLFCIICLPEQA